MLLLLRLLILLLATARPLPASCRGMLALARLTGIQAAPSCLPAGGRTYSGYGPCRQCLPGGKINHPRQPARLLPPYNRLIRVLSRAPVVA